MSWAGCQNNPIYLNFYLQKSLEIFEKNSADKIWSNKDIGVKMPCPVSDRVKKGTTLWSRFNIVNKIRNQTETQTPVQTQTIIDIPLKCLKSTLLLQKLIIGYCKLKNSTREAQWRNMHWECYQKYPKCPTIYSANLPKRPTHLGYICCEKGFIDWASAVRIFKWFVFSKT